MKPFAVGEKVVFIGQHYYDFPRAMLNWWYVKEYVKPKRQEDSKFEDWLVKIEFAGGQETIEPVEQVARSVTELAKERDIPKTLF